jgi:hypothetical protein
MQNPPADWLLAAQLGYKSPEDRRKEAVDNTRRMFEMIKGWEAAGQRAKDKGSIH